MFARPAGDVVVSVGTPALGCAADHATAAPSKRRRAARFRSGRWFLLIEGLLAGLLAGLAMVAHGLRSVHGMEGFTVWGLTLSPERSGLLFAFGAAAVLATLNRRAATAVAVTGTAAFFVLTTLGETAVLPRRWGVDPHNTGVFAGLLVYNFALTMWLVAHVRDPAPRTDINIALADRPRTGG